VIQRFKDRRNAEGGFTLIELLVVIIILGILAAVVVFAVGGIGDKGQSSACKIDTRTLRTAGEARSAQLNDYGATPADWTAAPTATGGGARTLPVDQQAKYVTPGFLSEISTMHNIVVYDSNPKAGGITPAIDITVIGPTTPVGAPTKCGGTNGATTNGTTVF